MEVWKWRRKSFHYGTQSIVNKTNPMESSHSLKYGNDCFQLATMDSNDIEIVIWDIVTLAWEKTTPFTKDVIYMYYMGYVCVYTHILYIPYIICTCTYYMHIYMYILYMYHTHIYRIE